MYKRIGPTPRAEGARSLNADACVRVGALHLGERERFSSTDIDTCLHNICRVVRNDVPRENNGCERSRDLMAPFHMRFALVESEPSDARGGKCRSPSVARFYGFVCSLTHGYGSRLEKCPNTDRELDSRESSDASSGRR